MSVSIPQAVSTIAIGKYTDCAAILNRVSIPQAVSTIAILCEVERQANAVAFQYRKR